MLHLVIPKEVYKAIQKKAALRDQSICSYIIYLLRREVGMIVVD